ncbi:MAG: hypothetical protein U0931_21390 [Vulcanimicrobiota bacterium]
MEAAELEQEMLELARTLSEEEWRTLAFHDFEAEVARFENGECDEESFVQFLENRERLILQTLQEYQQSSVLPHEVSAETVVAHRLLTDGMQAWLLGVQLVLKDEVDEGLAEIEAGNRLLVAVQRLNQRIQAQQLPPKHTF